MNFFCFYLKTAQDFEDVFLGKRLAEFVDDTRRFHNIFRRENDARLTREILGIELNSPSRKQVSEVFFFITITTSPSARAPLSGTRSYCWP